MSEQKTARRSRAHVGVTLKQQLLKEGKRLECVVCHWRAPLGLDHILPVHHVIPVALGGTDDSENLLLLCPNHHAVAHAMFPVRRGIQYGPATRDEMIKALRHPDAYYQAAQDHIRSLLR